MKRAGSLLVCLACLMTCGPRLHAYLKLGTNVNGRTVSAHWSQFPIRYFVANRGVPGVTPTQFQQTMARAFSTWDSVEGVSISSDFAGFTSASPLDDDSVSVLGFVN